MVIVSLLWEATLYTHNYRNFANLINYPSLTHPLQKGDRSLNLNSGKCRAFANQDSGEKLRNCGANALPLHQNCLQILSQKPEAGQVIVTCPALLNP